MAIPSSSPNRTDWLEPLNAVRHALLQLHKTILEFERERYEQLHGPIESSGALLQLLMSDSWFAWLRPLSGLIVQIDELVDDKDSTCEMADALHAESRRLLQASETGGDFQREYFRAIQGSSEVASAHGEWKRVAPKVKSA